MRLLIALAVALVVVAPDYAQSAGGAPVSGFGITEHDPMIVIAADSTHYRLVVTREMARVLQDSVPGFEPWPMEHYHADVREWFILSHRNAPSAVIGDWNGDGIQDLAAVGHDRTRRLFFALLSTGPRFRFLMLSRYILPYDPAVPDPRTEFVFLGFEGPGRIEGAYSVEKTDPCDSTIFDGDEPALRDDFVIIHTDAFQDVGFEKASVLYYWVGSKFEEFLTSD